MDRGTDARSLLLNKGEVPLKLGYVGIKNRSQGDINQKKTVIIIKYCRYNNLFKTKKCIFPKALSILLFLLKFLAQALQLINLLKF